MQARAAAQQRQDLAFGELLVAHLSVRRRGRRCRCRHAAGGEGEGAGSGAAVAAMAARVKRLRAACLVTGAPDTSDAAGGAAPCACDGGAAPVAVRHRSGAGTGGRRAAGGAYAERDGVRGSARRRAVGAGGPAGGSGGAVPVLRAALVAAGRLLEIA